MKKNVIIISLLALSFVWLDYECYQYVGLSFIDYKCLPYATRLGWDRDAFGHHCFDRSSNGGYTLFAKWCFGKDVYDDPPMHLVGFNSDTLIYITNIKGYGYSRKQNEDKKLIIHCAGENNDEFWIAPFPIVKGYNYHKKAYQQVGIALFPTEEGYDNLQIQPKDINLKDYKWIDLDGAFAYFVPIIYVIFLIVAPVVFIICIIRIIIYAIRTIRQKHKPA